MWAQQGDPLIPMTKFKMNNKVLAVLVLTGVLGTLQADVGDRRTTTTKRETTTTTTTRRDYSLKQGNLFRAVETSFDVFGLWAAPEDGFLDDGFGGGLGMNHFFTRNFGVGLDGYWWDGDPNEVVSSFSGSLIWRAPIERLNLAPYVFGGGGGHFATNDQASLHAGGGLEWRMHRNFGTFADGRYVFTDDTNDFGLIRFGLRFPF
jgi:hypothetical protein